MLLKWGRGTGIGKENTIKLINWKRINTSSMQAYCISYIKSYLGSFAWEQISPMVQRGGGGFFDWYQKLSYRYYAFFFLYIRKLIFYINK